MSVSDNSSVKKKFNWLGALAWGAGSAIFGWLLAGLIYQRDYRNLTWDALGAADWWMAVIAGLLGILLSYLLSSKGNKTSADSETKSGVDSSDTFSRVLSALLPALYLVLALATLVLTLATYNGDWMEARQGLATGFAALLAAVGAIVSVFVTYKIGEENRKAQQENLNQQLTHQTDNLEKQLKQQDKNLQKQLYENRRIEDNKDKREQNKQDAETIKSLNDRLHDILPRRNSEDEKERISSYFQLAALYKDWDLLAENSEKVEKQKDNQQKYILKLLFGTAEKDDKGNFVEVRKPAEDIALNSIISDLFISVENKHNAESGLYNGDANSSFKGYDLEYADLSHLNFYGKLLDNSDFSYAFLDGVRFVRSFLQGARFSDAYLDEARFDDAFCRGARFYNAYLDDAIFDRASLEGASFTDASLKGASFNGAKIFQNIEDKGIVLVNLADAKSLPSDDQLLKIEGFTEEMLIELKRLIQK